MGTTKSATFDSMLLVEADRRSTYVLRSRLHFRVFFTNLVYTSTPGIGIKMLARNDTSNAFLCRHSEYNYVKYRSDFGLIRSYLMLTFS